MTVSEELDSRITNYSELLDTLFEQQKELRRSSDTNMEMLAQANDLLKSASVALYHCRIWEKTGEKPDNAPSETLAEQLAMAETLYNSAASKTELALMPTENEVEEHFSLSFDEPKKAQGFGFVNPFSNNRHQSNAQIVEKPKATSWIDQRIESCSHG